MIRVPIASSDAQVDDVGGAGKDNGADANLHEAELGNAEDETVDAEMRLVEVEA